MKWYWSKYPTWVKVLVILGGIIGISMALWDGFKGSQKASEWFPEKGSTTDNNRKASTEMKEPVSYDNRKANADIASSVLKVKGFYLGMNIDEAADLLNKKYANIISKPASVEQLKDGTFRITIGTKIDLSGLNEMLDAENAALEKEAKLTGMPKTESADKAEALETESSEITAGTDKKVNKILFKEDIIDPLFNSKDMSLGSFAEEFAKAYGISYLDFRPFSNEEFDMFMGSVYEQGYKYSSDSGYYIQISTKYFFVESVRNILSSKILLIKAIPKLEERSFN